MNAAFPTRHEQRLAQVVRGSSQLTPRPQSFYDTVTSTNGFGRADLLSSLALFDDNPQRINSLEAEFRKVTPELLQKTAREYLRKTNRTVLVVEPAGR